MASGLPGAVLGSNQGNILSTNWLLSWTAMPSWPPFRPLPTQSMKSSSAPAPSICGFARITTCSPLAMGVASSRDSSMRACMQPLANTTPRHADVSRIALFIDVLPGLDSGVSDGRGKYATLQHLLFETRSNTPWFPFTWVNPETVVREYAQEA